MDAWERLITEAKDTLTKREGEEISWREIVRRAGFDDVDFGRVSYHLRPRTRVRGKHHVPDWLIDALEPVLPVSRDRLVTAAAEAAGYDLVPAVAQAAGTFVRDDQRGYRETVDAMLAPIHAALEDDSIPFGDRRDMALEIVASIASIAMRQRERLGIGASSAGRPKSV